MSTKNGCTYVRRVAETSGRTARLGCVALLSAACLMMGTLAGSGSAPAGQDLAPDNAEWNQNRPRRPVATPALPSDGQTRSFLTFDLRRPTAPAIESGNAPDAWPHGNQTDQEDPELGTIFSATRARSGGDVLVYKADAAWGFNHGLSGGKLLADDATLDPSTNERQLFSIGGFLIQGREVRRLLSRRLPGNAP